MWGKMVKPFVILKFEVLAPGEIRVQLHITQDTHQSTVVSVPVLETAP
jgi:hypothetical protein